MNNLINQSIQSLKRRSDAPENWAYYEGNQLHVDTSSSFKGYIGILPPTNAPNYDFTTKWLERIFAATNLIKASVRRLTDAILSGDVNWDPQFPANFSDDTKDKLRIELEAVQTDWWNDNNYLHFLRNLSDTIALESECYIRPVCAFAPRDDKGDVVTASTLAHAYDLIDFQIIRSDAGGIFTDKTTGKKFSVCKVTNGNKSEIEYSYVDSNGLTVLAIISDTTVKQWAADNLQTIGQYIDEIPQEQKNVIRIDLGKRLYLHKVSRDQIITETARSLQRSVNYALTTMNKNLNIAGSRETSYGNTQKPTKETVERDGQGNITKRTKQDATLIKGADNANFFVGLPIVDPEKKDKEGNPLIIGYEEPLQFVVDPVAVDTFVKAFEVYRELFLEEVNQAHILGANLTVSGKSKQETRSDFHKSAKASKIAIDPAGRYMLDTGTSLAAYFAKRIDLKGIRYDFSCKLTVGAVDLEEIKQESEDVQKGLSDIYNLLVLKGVEDPDAFISRLKSADDYVLNQLQKALKINNENPAIPLEILIEYLPIEKADKDKLTAAIKPLDNSNNGGAA